MARDNVLILAEVTKEDWEYIEWKKNGLNVQRQFQPVNKFLRMIRRIWIRFGLPGKQLWYGKWKKNLQDVDTIILHISHLNLGLPEYVNKRNPDIRIIGWYWNRVDEKTTPDKIKGKCEVWSFDPEDCKKYHMNYNHQYYFKSMIENSESTGQSEKEPDNIISDVYFCGIDSGRGEKLTKLYEMLKKEGICPLFQVVNSKYEHMPAEMKAKRQSYESIKDHIKGTRAILELLRKGQSGATIRLMESVYFQKKLITDNPYVKKEPFYHPDNIFVLEDNNMNELKAFMEKPLKVYSEDIKNQYDVFQWLDNFNQK